MVLFYNDIDFPNELILAIYLLLTHPTDVVNLSSCSKGLYGISNDTAIWRQMLRLHSTLPTRCGQVNPKAAFVKVIRSRKAIRSSTAPIRARTKLPLREDAFDDICKLDHVVLINHQPGRGKRASWTSIPSNMTQTSVEPSYRPTQIFANGEYLLGFEHRQKQRSQAIYRAADGIRYRELDGHNYGHNYFAMNSGLLCQIVDARLIVSDISGALKHEQDIDISTDGFIAAVHGDVVEVYDKGTRFIHGLGKPLPPALQSHEKGLEVGYVVSFMDGTCVLAFEREVGWVFDIKFFSNDGNLVNTIHDVKLMDVSGYLDEFVVIATADDVSIYDKKGELCLKKKHSVREDNAWVMVAEVEGDQLYIFRRVESLIRSYETWSFVPRN